jgi:hypothetical protein
MAMKPLLAALALIGCAATPIHAASERTPAAPEAAYGRRVVAADGIEIRAFLWDAALLSAAGWPDGWKETYLDRTSFTVVVEVEDRWPEISAEALLDENAWTFRMGRSAAEDVRLLVVDRFPTAAGRHHHRLVFAVHFHGALRDSVRGRATVLLRVGMRPQDDAPRPMTGQPLRSRGAKLRFVVEPA